VVGALLCDAYQRGDVNSGPCRNLCSQVPSAKLLRRCGRARARASMLALALRQIPYHKTWRTDPCQKVFGWEVNTAHQFRAADSGPGCYLRCRVPLLSCQRAACEASIQVRLHRMSGLVHTEISRALLCTAHQCGAADSGSCCSLSGQVSSAQLLKSCLRSINPSQGAWNVEALQTRMFPEFY